MIQLVIIYLYLIFALLVGMMAWQFYRGTHELISFRNIAIIGFCLFQLHSAALGLQGYGRLQMELVNPEQTALIYATWITIFTIVFLWVYEQSLFTSNLAKKVPTTQAVPTDNMLWMLAICMLVVSFLFRFSIHVPLLSTLGNIWGRALAIGAVGLLGWIWGRRLYNPFVIAGVGVLGLIALAILLEGAFGRRPLIAAGAALLWGMYFANMRYLPRMKAAAYILCIALIPLVLVALFTSARDRGQDQRTGFQQITHMAQRGDVGGGMELLQGGQDAGTNSLWLIEQYPDGPFETRYFHTIRYTFAYPVPRDMWAGKPDPLSDQLPHMARLPRVNRDALTLGPGIMGHIAAEGRWIALFVYAILGGLLIRFLDELTWHNTRSPLVIVALGSSFGQILGLARGETAAFAAIFYLGVIFTYIFMICAGKMLERTSPTVRMSSEPGEWDEDDEYAEDEYAEDEWPVYGYPAREAGPPPRY